MSKNRVRVGYSVADLASNLVFQMMSSYLLFFYTDVLGIAAAVGGTIMMLTRVIDGFTDIGMGLLVDRTNTRWGKSRPWFLFGAIPFGLIGVAAFTVPNFGPQGKIIWAFVTYVALSCAYTVVNIPLTTILPRLTSDDKERTILVTVRMICSMVGATIVTTFTTPLVNYFGKGDQAHGFFITVVIYAVVAVMLFFVTFANTEEKVKEATQGKKSSIKEDIKSLNGSCVVLFLFAAVYFVVNVVRSSSIIYYFTYNLNRVDLVPMIGILGTFSGLPSLLCLPYITGRIGKRNSVILGGAVFIGGELLMLVGKTNTPLLLVGLVTTGMGMYLMQATMFAISPDTIDYCEYKSGHNIGGMVTALFGFFAKLGMGISNVAIGAFLTWGGYIPNQEQTERALSSIQTSFIWIPIVFTIVIIVIMMFYKLDKMMPEIQEELERRRQATN